MIKVIAFDYAGVITEGPLTKWTKEHLKPTDEKYKAYKEGCDKWDLGLMSNQEVNKVLSFVTGIPQDKIWEKIYLKPKLNLETVNLIKTLKKNYKIFLFSNFISEYLHKLLEKDGIAKLFDEVIASSDYGMKKPAPNFFELLVKKAGVEKNEILFTDDSHENVNAANDFGIKSFFFTDNQNLIKDFQKEEVKI